MLRTTIRNPSSSFGTRTHPRNSIRVNRNFVPSRSVSDQTPPTTLITTPIFYVNSSPHIGHLYSALIADCVARWNRIKGQDVLFTTGTDEHGMKIQQAAEKMGKSPKEFCDKYSDEFRALFKKANISYDDYIRTTEPRHERAVSEMWRRLKANDLIYLGKYEGWYSVPDEAFLTEDQVTTIDDTVNGGFTKISIESGHRVDWVVEHNYRFKLQEFQQQLRQHYKNHPDAIVPSGKYKEVQGLLAQELPDLSISRIGSRVRWGLKVPDDPSQSIYVWLDALTNYLTVTGFPDPGFEKKWPASYHVIGKDILKFHSIYWPAFLLGVGLPLPKKIVTHSHWTVNHVKMSKSLGNVISPDTLFQEYGVDPTRYFLLAEGGISDDADFSSERMKIRRKTELSDAYGNLVMRCTGATLLPSQKVPQPGTQNPEDQKLIDSMNAVREKFDKFVEQGEISKGIEAVLSVLYEGNRYFQGNAPWELRPKANKAGDQARLDTILYNAIECVRICSIIMSSVMPDKMGDVLKSIGVEEGEKTWEKCKHGAHPPGRPIKHCVPFEMMK